MFHFITERGAKLDEQLIKFCIENNAILVVRDEKEVQRFLAIVNMYGLEMEHPVTFFNVQHNVYRTNGALKRFVIGDIEGFLQYMTQFRAIGGGIEIQKDPVAQTVNPT